MIDVYIDENKAMVKKMFGEYTPPDDVHDEETLSSSVKKEENSYSMFDGTPINSKKRTKRFSTNRYNDNTK